MKVTYFPKAQVWEALRSWAGHLSQERPEVVRVLLFGSVARDEAVPGSDVDVMLELSASDRPFPERSALYKPLPFPAPVEVFAYTSEEMAGMLAQGNQFLSGALKEGIELFRRGS